VRAAKIPRTLHRPIEKREAEDINHARRIPIELGRQKGDLLGKKGGLKENLSHDKHRRASSIEMTGWGKRNNESSGMGY